jgi:hypothetical protein
MYTSGNENLYPKIFEIKTSSYFRVKKDGKLMLFEISKLFSNGAGKLMPGK